MKSLFAVAPFNTYSLTLPAISKAPDTRAVGARLIARENRRHGYLQDGQNESRIIFAS